MLHFRASQRKQADDELDGLPPTDNKSEAERKQVGGGAGEGGEEGMWGRGALRGT